MSPLNLHSREPVPEPDDEITPSETPPGLDAIRTWLKKPRPWLHGLWLWIHWFLTRPLKAYEWLRNHGPRIKKTLRRIAAEGTLARRVLERVGRLLRETAVKTDAAARAFRDPRGENQRASGELEQVGETVRRLNERITFGARIVGIIVSVLNRLADLFPAEPPAPVPAPEPEPGPTPRPRSLPSGEPPEEIPPGSPVPGPPETHTPVTGPPETHNPVTGPPETHNPAPAPPETDAPDSRATRPPAPHASEAPASETPTPETPPPETPRPRTPAIPQRVDWETRLKGLPSIVHPWVKGIGKRPRRPRLHALILKICSVREWTTSKELARFLDMHQSNLAERHLSALVEAGLLELKYPDRPRDPRQAYRSTPEAAAHM